MIYLLTASFPESILVFRGPLIRALQERGVCVHVAAPGLAPGQAVLETLESMGVFAHNIPLRRAGTNPLADLALVWSLYRLARRIRPEVFVGYTVKPVIYGSIASWLARVPHRYALITGLGFSFTSDRRGVVPALIHKMYRLALGKVDKVFFQNADDQAMFRENGILADRTPSVVVNGSGVDLAEYRFTRLPESVPRFLMIARLLGDKGVREYVEAARQVHALRPDSRFDLVGWIDENPDAISPAELTGWVEEGHIEFHGRLSDVREIIAKSTVYVLPSYREGTPRTVLEAMAMGRPIITSDAPGCRETVIDGENGFLVPVKSVDALIEAMLSFLDDPSLAVRMGERSREIVEGKYDVHKVNAVLLHEMGIT